MFPSTVAARPTAPGRTPLMLRQLFCSRSKWSELGEKVVQKEPEVAFAWLLLVFNDTVNPNVHDQHKNVVRDALECVMEACAGIRDTAAPVARTTAPTRQRCGPAPGCNTHPRQRTARHLFTQSFLSRKDLSVWKLFFSFFFWGKFTGVRTGEIT